MRFPRLAGLPRPIRGYDLILVVGVWQHLPAQDHRQAVQTLAGRLAPRGRLIISLRHGRGAASRPCFPADPDVIVSYAADAGLGLEMRCAAPSLQPQNQARGVTWTWLALARG